MNFLTQKIQNSSIKKNMIYVTLAPLLTTIVLSIFLVAPRINQAISFATIASEVETAVILTNLLHEQQKERGASAVFLGSGGEKFGPEMNNQRQETSKRRADALAAIPAYRELIANNPEFSAMVGKVDQLLNDLGRIDEIHANVDSLDMTTAEVVAYFTDLNALTIAVIKDMSKLSIDTEMTASIIALTGFLGGKERAGIERAVGAGAFSSGSFSAKTLAKFEGLINVQNVYYSIFLADATASAARAFENAMTSTAAQDVQRMRDIAIQAGPDGDLQGITGKGFFDAQTQKINLLKQVEDLVTSDLIALANSHGATARTVAFISTFAAIAVILIAVVAALMISGLVRRNMLAVSEAAAKMAQGDLQVSVPEASDTELGQISGALDQFRHSIIEGQTREAEQKEKDQAEETRKRAIEQEEQQAAKEKAEAERCLLEEKRKDEQQITSEIATVVSACAKGDFSQRLDMANKDGIFAELCTGINQIAEITETNINDIVRCIGELSQGDLGTRIEGDRQGAFLQMKEDFNDALTNMARTMAQIMQSGRIVFSTSSELETASLNMAKRSEDNAAAVEETSAAVEQISASIRLVVANAKAANEATQKVQDSAAMAREVSNETEASISEMTEASAQINTVVKVIEDIAFQINLLALNAGVEAARAGDAGRGFTVVASEVRALAQRSQEAVKEIGQVIEQNSRSVEVGVEKVGLSRKALEGIVSEVEFASSQISEITSAVEQQATGIDEVNSAIRSIDSTTHTNAAALEEMTASSVSLSEEAKALGDELSHFHGISGDLERVETDKVVAFEQSPDRNIAPVEKKVAVSGGGYSVEEDWAEI